jgi:hypothetical protein
MNPTPIKILPRATPGHHNDQAAFDAAYWAAQPLEIQRAMKITPLSDRINTMEDLAVEGFQIDRQTMAIMYQWSPYLVMFSRFAFGYTWVPAVGQQDIDMPPGIFGVAGKKVYNPNPPYPVGSIAVPDPEHCDLALWYPSRTVAKPKPTPIAIQTGPYIGEVWPDMDILTGKHGCRQATAAGAKTPTLFETQETGLLMIHGLYFTGLSGFHYFMPKDQLAPGERPPNL